MEVAQAIRTKRAVRSFSDVPISGDDLRQILYAGRRAQSAKNTQPWAFIAITDRARLVALSKLGTFAGHLAGAAAAVAILTPDPAQRWSILFDAGQTAAYMQLAAWSLGIVSCPATIYEPEAARELLKFPEDFHLHVALSFGYPRDPAVLTYPPRLGGRRSFEESVHFETWSHKIGDPPPQS
jgi:nitroreductase